MIIITQDTRINLKPLLLRYTVSSGVKYTYTYITAFILFSISIRNITAKHVGLIDHVNLACSRNAKIIRPSSINSKSTSDQSQGLRHLFFSLKVGLCLAILVLYYLW